MGIHTAIKGVLPLPEAARGGLFNHRSLSAGALSLNYFIFSSVKTKERTSLYEYPMPDSFRDRKPVWDKWVKNMQGKGHANAQEILDSVINLSKE